MWETSEERRRERKGEGWKHPREDRGKGLKRWQERRSAKREGEIMREWLLLPSALLLLQVSNKFLQFGFPDAHSSASFSVFLPGGLPSISVWIGGIEDEGEGKEKKKTTHKRVYLFEDGLSVFKSHMEENRESGEGEKDREKVILE